MRLQEVDREVDRGGVQVVRLQEVDRLHLAVDCPASEWTRGGPPAKIASYALLYGLETSCTGAKPQQRSMAQGLLRPLVVGFTE